MALIIIRNDKQCTIISKHNYVIFITLYYDNPISLNIIQIAIIKLGIPSIIVIKFKNFIINVDYMIAAF